MMCSWKIFVYFAVFSLGFEPCFSRCGQSEHKTGKGCCSKCEAAQGLRVNTPCTQSSDAVCEPREGHYCTDYSSGGCIQAVEHSKCRPGEYVKQQGTAAGDTECDECADGTYSDGSFQSCRPHSVCEAFGRTEIKAGTRQSDTECVIKLSAGAIVGITLAALVVLGAVVGAVVAIILCLMRKCKTAPPTVYEVKDEPEQCKTEKVEFWWIKQVFLKMSITKVYEEEAPPSIEKC